MSNQPPIFTRVDLSSLPTATVDPTKYVLRPFLPRGHVTLLGGHGGSGKSILALVVAAHAADGQRWNGLEVTQSRALFVSLEDAGELVRYRLRKICDEYGLPVDMVAANVTVLDGANSDAELAAEVSTGGTRALAFTLAMSEIEAAAEGHGLIVIDNASDAFGADENVRRMVRAFIRRLAQLARKHDAAVLLLAHIDKAAARNGSAGNTYSGSTSWHNSVRSRLALIEDDGTISLVQEKNNLGPKFPAIPLRWSNGVLMPSALSGSEAVDRDAADDTAVLEAIRSAIASGATVHPARSGSHSTLAVLRTYPELPETLRRDKGRFWAAVTRLERAGRVGRETYRNEYRKERVRLSVCAAPPHPLRTDARGACVGAPVEETRYRRTTGALAQTCPKCGGDGCSWCRQ